jgi:NAD-dependent dihydropyrimidine dehydrogenase PreA subunit
MIRKIIKINQELCNGCGLCVDACHESAIGLINGKAALLRDDYCDGLGNCLPACPTNAITFEEREALAFNEEEVKKNIANAEVPCLSQLNQWPVQIKLVPVNAPYFTGSNLLIAADCTAYAYGNFHNEFMKNKITLIGCPKLDSVDYSEKLTEILKQNDIKSITVVRMIVPCCGGIVHAVTTALKNSGKMIPWQVITISTDGSIIEM